jgi:2-polyprenyl-3-methyl-5-hydroxy-6-metoxy-1,4-benzoquinol methylase
MHTAAAVASGMISDPVERFGFGANWQRYLRDLTPQRITAAVASVSALTGRTDLRRDVFLDAGSGSGLFSLAAHQLGAQVISLDYDAQSVACAAYLRDRFAAGSERWEIRQGSVLDTELLATLPRPTILYSWGVLHHTGHQWPAFERLASRVQPGGLFVVALYNDQGWISSYWTGVKRLSTRSRFCRATMVAIHAPYLVGLRALVRAVRRRGPLERGMSLWTDTLDWVGGYPFEVAARPEVVARAEALGLTLRTMHSCGRRHGCNEFVFERTQAEKPA